MSAPGTAREEHQAMEFSVTKSALLSELSMTQGVVERKTTIPILSNLLVEAKGSQLTITATDLELSVRKELRHRQRKNPQNRPEAAPARQRCQGPATGANKEEHRQNRARRESKFSRESQGENQRIAGRAGVKAQH
jgi:hypothetical protein